MEGFEDIILPKLTAEEKKASRLIASVFNNNPNLDVFYTNNQIAEWITSVKYDLNMNPVRVRKMINYIRVEGFVVGLIATSKGYKRTKNIEEIKKYEKSLRHRVEAIILLLGITKRDIDFLSC